MGIDFVGCRVGAMRQEIFEDCSTMNRRPETCIEQHLSDRRAVGL